MKNYGLLKIKCSVMQVSLTQGEKRCKHKCRESHFRQDLDSKVKTQMTIWVVFIDHVVWKKITFKNIRLIFHLP